MNKLTNEKRAAVVRCLVEGNSIRATVRITGIAKNTVTKLLVDLGRKCAEYQDKTVRNLNTRRIECDEIWAFCYAKEKNVPAEKKGELGYGDVWTWTAIDADSKLCISWLVGDRSAGTATEFMQDVASRLSNRVQLTTDGHKAYLEAVEAAFGGGVDYAQIMKVYGGYNKEGATRYSPGVVNGVTTIEVEGKPNRDLVSTSYVERNNLTMRMGMRRFTRLTNGFSKKVENLMAAVSLHFMYYNFCRIHQTLRCTPAMKAGVTRTLWTVEDLVKLLD